MGEIDELIEKLCPNGVEYKTIQELCSISRGQVMSKNYIRDNFGDYPVYSSQTENNGELGKISTYDFDGEYLTWTTDGANAGSVFYRDGKFSATNVCGLLKVISNEIITKFLYYELVSEAPKWVNAGMGNPKLMSNVMSRIKVAVPPLEVQCKIVRILDDFTELSVELSTELKTRKEQYKIYQDKLLKPKFEYKKIKMSDICNLITKQTGFDYSATIKPVLSTEKNERTLSFIQNKDFEGKKFNYNTDYYIPIEVANKFPKIILDTTSILFSISGKIGNIGLFQNKEKAFIGGAICICKLKENIPILPEYIMHYLQSRYGQKYLFKNIKAASHLNITVESIRELEILYPNLEKQKEIVNILDKFDKLCNDISEGLPAEIEARQKQYEYYRDKLLNFKELKVR